MPPSVRPALDARAGGKGNGVRRPASAEPRLNFSLLRLAVPERLVLAGAAAGLLWLAIAWALA